MVGYDRLGTLSLRQAIERHLFGEVAKVTCSFGVAEYVPGDSAEDLTARADVALYRAKLNGRNCVELAPMPTSRSEMGRVA